MLDPLGDNMPIFRNFDNGPEKICKKSFLGKKSRQDPQWASKFNRFRKIAG